MSNKERFISILKETCAGRNVDSLIEYLEQSTDFFDAPASTKFHLCERGGLLQHSLNVYDTLSALCELYYEDCSKDTIAIVSLLHDICKANFYKQEMKNVKTALGWTTQPTYVVDDQLPLGHGEKSVIMILSSGFKLKENEMLAIRWHMSGFDAAIKGGEYALSSAYSKTKLIALLQAADIICANALES